MAYFSPRSTWLSLVDGSGSPGSERPRPDADTPLDGLSLSFEDFRPCLPADGDGPDSDASNAAREGVSDTAEDLDYLRITLELRHRLFFHFKEWEFGPALLEDHLRLARAQTDPEEALAHYCQARYVAVTLVDKYARESFRLAWIEADRVIAEIHNLIGNDDSCAVYAREGLEAIKSGRFSSSLDMRVTKLTVRFLNLLGRS